MSILRRTQQMSACAALAAFAALAQVPTNLYLLPNSSATAPTTYAYRTDPFSQLTSFSVQPGAAFLLMHPNGQKLYSIARSGADTLLVLDANSPGTVIKRQSLGQAEAAVLSPDGRRLVIAAGSLHIVDTTSDTILASLSDVGNTPIDVAIALDGSRAFVLSQVSNKLTAVDLNTNTVAGPAITVPGAATGVAVGNNGLVYVSTVNLIQVIDGRSMTVVKEIQLNASPGKLIFTPDGQNALTVNRTPVTGSSVLFFDVPGNKLLGTIPNFGVVLDRVVFGSGNRVYGFSAQTSTIYEISTSPLNINPPQFSGFTETTGILDLAVSGEVPNSRFLFVLKQGTIRRFDLSSNPALDSGAAATPPQFGSMVHLTQQSTGTPTAILAYNTAQTTTPGGTYLPLIARVTNSVGRPLFGVNVTFSTDNPNAQILGATVATNTQGWAQTTVVAPSSAGTFNVTAAAGPGPGQPTATYVLTTSTGSTGGTATGLLTIAGGQGQLVAERFLLKEPLAVKLRDNNGNPVAGQVITFTLTNGSATLSASTSDGTAIGNVTCSGTSCTAVTDAQGIAQIGMLADLAFGGLGYTQQTITATNGQATVNFYVTTYGLGGIGGGTPVSPQIVRVKPEQTENLIIAQTGTTLNDAVQIRVVTITGQPIPNVALRVRTGNTDPALGPVAACNGEGDVALTDATGLASCNLKVGGKIGLTSLNIDVGGGQGLGGASINLDVRPGPPANLRILQGNNQSGNPGQRLTLAFVVQVEDASGNVLPGQAATWEIVTPNSITLSNVVTVADSSGRLSALGTLGQVAGSNQVRVRVGAIVQTFNFTTNLTISQLVKVSGDGQTALVNQPFAGTLVVEVRDERNTPVPNQAVAWSVTGGSATLSASTAATDANGRSTITVRAGNTAGTVTVQASLRNLTQAFTLTVRPPGPVFTAAGIVTTARNQPGIAPCGLATIYGSNIAIGVTGVVNTTFNGVGALPLSYNGVEIEMGGAGAPILAVANQAGTESLVVQAPCELAAPGRTTVTIRIPGAQATVENVQVFRAAPGVFETPATSSQRAYAAIVRPDGSYVTPTNPARRGEVVMAAVTGLGQTSPAAATNRIGIGTQTVTAPLIVGLNDQGVRIVSAAYAPGLIGVYWVAFEIPLDTTPGAFRSFAIAAESPTGELVFGNGSAIAAIQ
ncbi:MAG: Ig-like domain-containing protein [Acidobacteria bacterium]|nr:Ig-like domain-containing protein [Acidobacteriota bacterium]